MVGDALADLVNMALRGVDTALRREEVGFAGFFYFFDFRLGALAYAPGLHCRCAYLSPSLSCARSIRCTMGLSLCNPYHS